MWPAWRSDTCALLHLSAVFSKDCSSDDMLAIVLNLCTCVIGGGCSKEPSKCSSTAERWFILAAESWFGAPRLPLDAVSAYAYAYAYVMQFLHMLVLHINTILHVSAQELAVACIAVAVVVLRVVVGGAFTDSQRVDIT